MRIPRKLTINGQIVRVKFVEMENVGEADFANSIIYLKKGMKRRATEETFFHEALHFFNTTMGHALLDSLSSQIYGLLRNNKLLK